MYVGSPGCVCVSRRVEDVNPFDVSVDMSRIVTPTGAFTGSSQDSSGPEERLVLYEEPVPKIPGWFTGPGPSQSEPVLG